MVLEFSKAQDNLDKLLGSPRMSFNKEGIGYNSFNKKKPYKISLFKMHPKTTLISYAITI